MIYRSFAFRLLKLNDFKHVFSSYFKIIHDFIKCRSTFVRSGIISKIYKIRTIVLRKQITKIYVKQQRSNLSHTHGIKLVFHPKVIVFPGICFSI